MGRKSRNKRMRKLLRPAPAAGVGRRAEPRSNAKAKVMKLLEAMVDAAQEDLTSGADKPRVSYGQALRAGELLVRYEAEESAVEPADEEAAEESGEPADITDPVASFAGLELSEDERQALMTRIRKEVAPGQQTAQTG